MKPLARIFGILLALLVYGCGVTSESLLPYEDYWKGGERKIRAAIQQNAKEAWLTVEGKGSFYDMKTCAYLGRYSGMKGVKVTAQDGIVCFNGAKGPNCSRVVLVPDNGELISIAGIRYRGQMEFLAGGSSLTVINHVGLEDYIAGVVPKECSGSWPLQCLKAQAVTARSFTMVKIAATSSKDYDMANSDQMYGGASGETPMASKAAYETAGECLYFKGKLLKTYFHTCCGGHTEDGALVFHDGKEYPEGVKSPYCKGTQYYSWSVTLSKEALVQKLSSAGKNVGSVSSIKITKTLPSGRGGEITVTGSAGKAAFEGEAFRKALGYKDVKSSLLSVSKSGSGFTISGRGWGHGVGLCQYCAKKMAEDGQDYAGILQHFYPGASIK